MAENILRSRGRPQGYKFDRGGMPTEMGPYIGIVVNNVDAIRSGRLDVWIEQFGATKPDGSPDLTDDSLWRAQAEIMRKGNLDDLCNVKTEFEELGYGNFAQKLVDELDDEELAELMETFSAMQYKTKKQTKLAVASTEQYSINWFRKTFPCIFDSDGNVVNNNKELAEVLGLAQPPAEYQQNYLISDLKVKVI